MTFTGDEINALPGTVVRDSRGDVVGTIVQVWADTAGQPTWVSVDDALMPLPGSYLDGGELRTPYDRAVVRSAPAVDVNSDDPLASNGLRDLYAHYTITLNDEPAGDVTAVAGDHDDDSMVRSEERLDVRTEEQQTRVRLRKYVVTEYVTTTVPVRREEVRLERVPVGEPDPDSDSGAVDAGVEVSESEHEIILHAERPVVTTETVPVERVRIGKETVTEQQTVGAEIRKERIEAELPDGTTRTVD